MSKDVYMTTVALDYDGVLTNDRLRDLIDEENAVLITSKDFEKLGVMADTIALQKTGNMEERLRKARKIAPYAKKVLLIDTEERMCSALYDEALRPNLVCPDRYGWQRQVLVC